MQCRADDGATRALIQPIEHEPSALATSLERAFLAAVGGGCVAPIGVHVRIEAETCRFWAVVAATDGTRAIRESRSWRNADAAEGLLTVEAIASEMLAAGAGELIADARERVE